MIIKEYQSLIEELMRRLAVSPNKIFAVDGKDGVGKSTLASKLSKEINVIHIELDKYLEKHKGYYVQALRLTELKADIQESLGKGSVIIEGICVREVLNAIDITPAVTIYVKRVAEYDLWLDEEKFERFSTPEEVFEQDREDLRQFRKHCPELSESDDSEDYSESVYHEMIRYHYKYKPHVNSEIVYHYNMNIV